MRSDTSYRRILVAGAAALILAAACSDSGSAVNGDDSGALDGSGGQNGNGNGSVNGNADGGSNTGNPNGPSNPGTFDPDAGCASVSAKATAGKRPSDIIIVIDNSGSMTSEIRGVEQNINDNFAKILDASGLDYRVILVSKHGDSSKQRICIQAPLSGNASCSPVPSAPAHTARFFQYDVKIESHDAYQRLLQSYDEADTRGAAPTGWQAWLRPDAQKVFLVITDDDEEKTSEEFKTQLIAKGGAQFGTVSSPTFVFHSIAGVKEKANAAEPYASTEAVVAEKCGSAVNTGQNYQSLSIETGGLRFPVCDPTAYNTVFQKIAEGVVTGSQVACEFEVPAIPPGFSSINRVMVQYTPGDGSAPKLLEKVNGSAECAANKFFQEGGRVKLCPDTCSAVTSDSSAKVDVVFTCGVEIM